MAHFDREVIPKQKEPPLALQGDAYAHNFREDDADYFTPPSLLFELLTEDTKQLLLKNTAAQVGGAQKFIQVLHIKNCFKADPAYWKE